MSIFKHQPNLKEKILLGCLVGFILWAAFGCAKKEGAEKTISKTGTDSSPSLAKVGKNIITADELRSYLSSRPDSHQSFVTREGLEGLLDELILEEVVYQEALRQKLEQEPEVRRKIRQILTQKLLDEHLKREVWNREIAESEIQGYYNRHRAEFSRPEQVRLADIYIAVPPDATEEKKAELKKKAEAALAEVLRSREKRTGFGTVLARYSDTPLKYPKGDTGFFDLEGQPAGVDKSLAQAAFNLSRVGSIFGQVIETADGYHVIMLTGKRAAVERSLDQVRKELKQRIQRETTVRARLAYMESLKNKAEITIRTEQIETLLKELKSQARDEGRTAPRIPVPPGSREAPQPSRETGK